LVSSNKSFFISAGWEALVVANVPEGSASAQFSLAEGRFQKVLTIEGAGDDIFAERVDGH
jgi:hypothetical protein